MAVGHTILVIIYHMLQQQKSYEELGGNYFDERERRDTEKRLVRRLEKLGYRSNSNWLLLPLEQYFSEELTRRVKRTTPQTRSWY